MNDSNLTTIEDLQTFLKASRGITFQRKGRAEAYSWIQETLVRFGYLSLNKFEKSIVKQYIMLMTKYSRAQITRFLSLYKHTGIIEESDYQRHCFTKIYDENDLRLLAQTD